MLTAKDALLSANIHRSKKIKGAILSACSHARTQTFTDIELTTTEQLDLTEKGYTVTKNSVNGFFINWEKPND